MLRGRRKVDPQDPFFRAHFFQDPVQPGSIGLQAMLWLAACFPAVDADEPPHLELSTPGACHWRYRGQVLPEHDEVTITARLRPVAYDDAALLYALDAALWVDGTRIYEAELRLRQLEAKTWLRSAPLALDPAVDSWLLDHCPNYTLPVLPMMYLADRVLAATLPEEPLGGLDDLRIVGWVHSNRPLTLHSERQGRQVRLMAGIDGAPPQEVASARLHPAQHEPAPDPLPPMGELVEDEPYSDARMFHGPAFQLLHHLCFTTRGASGLLDTATPVPIGRAHPALLDAGMHAMPQDRMETWFDACPPGRLAVPLRMESLRLYGAPPEHGQVRCEIRPDGCGGAGLLPRFMGQWIVGDKVWAATRLAVYLVPLAASAAVDRLKRRAYTRDAIWVDGIRASSAIAPDTSRLSVAKLLESDWLPGSIAHILGTDDPAEVLAREHIAAAHRLHPCHVRACLPLHKFSLNISREGEDYQVQGAGWGKSALDLGAVQRVRLSTPDVLEQARAAGCGLCVVATPYAKLADAHAWTQAAVRALGLELPILGDSLELCAQVQPAWAEGPLELLLDPVDSVPVWPGAPPVTVVRSAAEREALWRFRYDRYVGDWHHHTHKQADHVRRRVYAPSDDLPGAIHLSVSHAGTLQAASSLQLWGCGEIPETRAEQLSFDLLPAEVKQLCVAEIHKLGVHPDAAGSPALWAVLAALFERGARLGGEILFVECVAAHVRQYLNVGFRPYGARLGTHHRRGFSIPLIAFWDPEHQARVGGLAGKLLVGLWPDGPIRLQPTEALRAQVAFGSKLLVYEPDAVQAEMATRMSTLPADSMLRRLSPEQYTELLRQAWIVDAPAGLPLATKDLREWEAFFVLEGQAEMNDADGVTRLVGAGDVVGLDAALAEDGLRRSDAEMANDGRVLVVQGAFLRQAVRRDGVEGEAWRKVLSP